MGENNLKKKQKNSKDFVMKKMQEKIVFLLTFIFLARESNFECQLLEIGRFLNFSMS